MCLLGIIVMEFMFAVELSTSVEEQPQNKPLLCEPPVEPPQPPTRPLPSEPVSSDEGSYRTSSPPSSPENIPVNDR